MHGPDPPFQVTRQVHAEIEREKKKAEKQIKQHAKEGNIQAAKVCFTCGLSLVPAPMAVYSALNSPSRDSSSHLTTQPEFR
jgi:hypothetical protein